MHVTSSLLTDLYQLTMAYGYWKLKMHEQAAVFQLVFRTNPFNGNYAIACGLASVVEIIKNWQFKEDEIAYLRTLHAANGDPLLSEEFLQYLATLKITCDIDAIPEGTIVFPHQPLIRVKGPIIQAQLLETILLNSINFQTLVATKAARIVDVAQGEVLEFGLRRAQGENGGLVASRAAYIGGCDATSNALAGKLYDIPVRGTHAHSWVTAFPSELEAFRAYASVMGNNCILLVDTYNSITGVENAILVGQELRQQGNDLLGVRLDSGDLAALSKKVRTILDEAGFHNTKIVASNSLDEYSIKKLKEQLAPIDAWGVGTHLVTAYDEPALDGIYKLTAIQKEDGTWNYKIKLSEQVLKISTPGICQVRRFFQDEQQVMDILYDAELGISELPQAQLFDEPTRDLNIIDFDACVDLLIPVFRHGNCVWEEESIHDSRSRAVAQRIQFLKYYRDTEYLLGLESQLSALKQKMIQELSKKR